MRLIQAKVRGTGATINTRWFDIHRRCTCIFIADGIPRRLFLSALHSINPDQLELPPPGLFTSQPKLIRKEGYQRRILPHKRTIAMGVYAAPPDLVAELGQISQHLYEIDRIEVGRRLDASRWLNFVELASSTRWSELTEAMQPYLTGPVAAKEQYQILRQLGPSDRVKGAVRDALLQLLDETQLGPDNRQKQLLRQQILRVDHFQKARSIVYEKLPRSTLYALPLSTESETAQGLQPGTEFIETLQLQVQDSILTAKQNNVEPLILIDLPRLQLNGAEQLRLGHLIDNLTGTSQVIIATGDASLLHLTANQLTHTDEQLTANIHQEEVS